jgi:lipopolysaccharide/colanic/teichoic acid biosynthesis glycosyltransferase
MTGIIVDSQHSGQVKADPSLNANLISNLKFRLKQGKLFISNLLGSSHRSYANVLSDLSTDADNWFHKYIGDRRVKIVQVSPDLGESRLMQLADTCHDKDVQILLQLPRICESPQKHHFLAWKIKRSLDWLAALAILLVLSPVMLGLAAIIKSTSKGSIFFYQWRVGERGRLFRIVKFRTMITNADKLHHLVMTGQNGLHKCKHDPRITSVGRWMRKYSLDELPQLFNILRGEMSLVGPRPWALYDALRINGYRKRRLNCLPGVTGAWQVSARSTMLDLDAVTDCDLQYLRQWSIWNDFKILLMTVPKVLSGFGAC